jgi:hypothetical protein
MVTCHEARGLRDRFSATSRQAPANLAAALEELFSASAKGVAAVNASKLKTVSHAMDSRAQAPSTQSGHDELAPTPIRKLGVGDDPVSLRTLMVLALNDEGAVYSFAT